MSADDDTELRDLLVQTLEKNGTLAKIRAQLRASVFLALEEQENVKKKAPLLNEKAKQFGDTDKGRLCAEVVADFLESLNLDNTLSVFAAEFQLGNRRPRSNLATALDLPSNSTNDDRPLLISLLENDVRRKNDKDLVPIAAKSATNTTIAVNKTKPTAGDNFVNGATYFGGGGGGKSFEDDNDDNSDDEDFFDSAGRAANAKRNLIAEKPPAVPSSVTIRDKTTGSIEKKDSAVGTKKEEAKSGGSSSLSFLGDLPTLSSTKNRPALPSLTKDKGAKDTDFMKLLGDSLDDTDSSPRDSARIVPGLDLKKLQEQKNETKNPKTSPPAANQSKNGSKEEAAKVQRKDSSADEDISEEIAEDLEVDDLLDSARSSRQLSF